MDRGCVTPVDLGILRDQSRVQEIDYICTLAGPLAEFLLTGILDETGEASAGDRRDAEAILHQLHGEDILLQGWQAANWGMQVDAILRDRWPVVEALAYELMRVGRFGYGNLSPSDIEAKYGLGDGGRNLTTARRASARRRLREFHATPEELARSVVASSRPNNDRDSLATADTM